MKYGLFSFLLVIWSFSEVISQDLMNLPQITPPSPEAAAFSRYAEIPVSYSTGVPDISVPLYSISCGKLELPISLSYHASGIKVRDMATHAGLGWVLNTGGIISRAILSDVDENPVVPFHKSSTHFDTVPGSYGERVSMITELEDLADGIVETQSDRFTYSFNGHSGAFVADYISGILKTVPYSPIRITKKNPSSVLDVYFEIVAEDGFIYTFQTSERSVTSGQGGGISSWHLTKIEMPDKKDSICFYYSAGDTLTSNFNSQTVTAGLKYTDQDGYTPAGRFIDVVRSQATTTHWTKKLDSIVSRSSVVSFTYAADRLDGGRFRVQNVIVKDRIFRNIIRQVSLYHSYFGSTVNNTSRLKLDSVKVSGSTPTPCEKYSFIYNSPQLEMPTYYQIGSMYDSFCEDYWGYYTTGGSPTLIPGEFFGSQTDLNYLAGNRNPDSTKMKMYVLTEIIYPTGGRTKFEYECNRVAPSGYYGYTNTNNGLSGGLRIKKIRFFTDSLNEASVKTYEYDPDYAYYLPITKSLFHYSLFNFYYLHGCKAFQDGCGIMGMGTTNRDVFVSTSAVPLTLSGESPIYYGKVSEYNGTLSNNTGKSVYFYSVPPNPIYDLFNELQFTAAYHFDRGNYRPLPDRQITYKNDNGTYKPLREIRNDYWQYKIDTFITGIKVNHMTNYVNLVAFPADDYWFDDYDYLYSFHAENTQAYTEIELLKQRDVYDYQEDTSHFIKQTEYYNYDTISLLPVFKYSLDSKGDTLKTIFRYPLDSAGIALYDTMINRNILSPVLTQQHYKNDQFLTSVDTRLKDWGDKLIAPEEIKTKQANQPFDSRILFHSYDELGNITSVSKSKNIQTSYIWGYNAAYPIAEVTNAKSKDIFYTSFEEGDGNSTSGDSRTGEKSKTDGFTKSLSSLTNGNYILTYWQKMVGGNWELQKSHISVTSNTYNINISIFIQIDEVRFYPENAMMTTYCFKPLVGVINQCDANNRITYYEYDDFNRLVLIRDQDRNIIKRICYNYAGQPEDCLPPPTFYNVDKSGSFVRNNCSSGYVGSSVTYTVLDSTYSSTISQVYVDSLAQADVNANGQSYANSNGTCTSSCSGYFSLGSGGWSSYFQSITLSGTTVNITVVMAAQSTSSFDNVSSTGVFIGYVSNCVRPSVDRTFSCYESGRFWNVTIYTNGQVRLTRTGGAALPNPYVGFSLTGSYSL